MTTISAETEMLARMWIECDPNRGGEPGSGFGPDDPMTEMQGTLEGKPRWHWFIPRAEATRDYLAKRGFTIAPKA